MSAADPWVPRPAKVIRVVAEIPGTVTLHLDASGRSGGFAFRPGQFAMLYAFGAGEVPISMCGDPAHPGALVHTVRAVGPVTRAIAEVSPGGVLGLRGPFGTGWPLDQAKGQDVVLVAGGLGLAPLRPAVLHILRHRADFARVALLYGARTPADLIYRDDLAAWAARPDVDLAVTVDRAGPDWKGHVGTVPGLLARASFDPRASVALVCGPEIMMRFCVRELLRLGLPADRAYLSLERNMTCALGFCGHCQFGPHFVCKDGPILRYDRIAGLLAVREA